MPLIVPVGLGCRRTTSGFGQIDARSAAAPPDAVVPDDAVVVAPCGFSLERTLGEIGPVAERLSRLSPRVLLMDGNAYLNRPGPRLVDAVERIGGWLRGADPDADGKAACELSAVAVAR